MLNVCTEPLDKTGALQPARPHGAALGRSLAAALTVLAVAIPVAGQAQTAVVIGGALRFDNDAVWQRIVDEAGFLALLGASAAGE